MWNPPPGTRCGQPALRIDGVGLDANGPVRHKAPAGRAERGRDRMDGEFTDLNEFAAGSRPAVAPVVPAAGD
jgi:hypothetical protein